jgi:lipoate-protein ligase A
MELRIINSGPSNAFYNMALDEALMLKCGEASATDGRLFPTIRFYAFSPPAITIGRFQSPQDVQDMLHGKNGFDIVQRITGGRAVMHDGDLTYSLVAPLDDPVFGGHTSEAYKKISLVFRDALKALNVDAELVRVKHSGYEKNPGCFSSAARYELQVNGKKILGSAQRREDGTILQQGSAILNSKFQSPKSKWHR